MSFNQIYDYPPYNSPIDPYKDAKFNHLRTKVARFIDITTGNINTNTINGVVPASLTPGANGQLFKTVAGTPTWQYFQLGDFSNSLGPANSVLTTNALATTAAWSKDLSIDSVDIADTDGIKLNGVPPGVSQFLGSDGLGVLGWQSIPASFGRSIYYVNQPQDLNSSPTGTVSFIGGYNNLVGQITFTSPTVFTVDTAGVYIIEFGCSVVASASEVLVTIAVNTGAFARGFYNLASSYASASTILSLAVGNVIQVELTRTNGNAAPKNVLPYNSSGQIMFTRLA